MRQIKIDPITRLEGHGKIDIFLNDDGEVANTYFRYRSYEGSSSSVSDGRWRRCPGLRPGSAVSAPRRTIWHP